MVARRASRVHAGTEASKRRILDAAMALAALRGYEGTTVSLISKKSGLPMGSVYWHFASKDALFEALIDRTFNQWISDPKTHPFREMSGSLRDKLLSALTGAADEHDPSQGFWRLGLILTLERRLDMALARKRFQGIREEVRETMAEDWAQALPDELIAAQPDLPNRIAAVLMAAADGLYVAINSGETAHTKETVETIADAIEALISKVE
jgi:AcrR family transcriptional regulator